MNQYPKPPSTIPAPGVAWPDDLGDNTALDTHKALESTADVLGHVKIDGTTITISDGIISAAIPETSSTWAAISAFTRVSDSSFTVTDNAANQAIFTPGRPIRYKDAEGAYNYGIIIGYTTGTVTLAGAPLDTSHDAVMEYADFNRVIPYRLIIPSTFAAAGASTTLINSILKTNELWGFGPAFLVAFAVIVDVDDSGANQTRVNVTISGNAVGTANNNAGLAIAETWVKTTTDINTSNYDIGYGDEIEVSCDAYGSNDDAKDLSVIMTFVLM